MTSAELITDARSATGDIVSPYKQTDTLYASWLKDAIIKLCLARPDAYTGYAASDISFAESSLVFTGILNVSEKFRPALVGWLIHRAGLHIRNDALVAMGMSMYKEGVSA